MSCNPNSKRRHEVDLRQDVNKLTDTYIELRDTSGTMLVPQPKRVLRARAYIVESGRVALEFETKDHTYRLDCADVDARDFAKLVREIVDQL